MRTNKHPEHLKLGQKVTTDFDIEYSDVIRTILTAEKTDFFGKSGTGYRVSVDGGPACKYFGKSPASKIMYVDAAWFIPAPTQETIHV